MHYRSIPFLLLLTTILFTACQPEPPVPEDALTHVPSDVSALAIMRPQQMMDKANFETVKEMAFYQEIIGKATNDNQLLGEVIADPARSGVDLTQNAYLALDLRFGGEDSEAAVFLFSLRDAAAFEKFVKSTELEVQPAATGYQYSKLYDREMVAWNDQVAVFVAGNPEEAVEKEIRRYFETDPAASLAQNLNLRRCLEEPFDMAVWLSSDQLAEEMSGEVLDQLGVLTREDLQGNYIHNYAFFEKGRIRSQSRFFIKKALTNDLDLLFREGVARDFTQLLPADGLQGMMTAALDLKGLNQLLIEKYSKGFAEEGLKRFGFTTDDLRKAFTGDLALGFYQVADTSFAVTEMVFVATIAEGERMNALLSGMQEKGMLAPLADNRYQLQEFEQEFKDEEKDTTIVRNIQWKGQVWIKDDLLYITGSDDLMDHLVAGDFPTESDLHRAVAERAQDNIFTMAARPGEWDENDPFEQIRAWTDRNEGQFILEMKEGEVNSLFYLFRQLNENYKRDKERKS